LKENIVSGLSYYFKRHPDYLEEILKQRKQSTEMKKVQQEVIEEIKTSITRFLALAIKYRLKISNNRYDLMRKMMTQVWNTDLEQWIPRVLKNLNVSMPNLFPSLKRLKQFEKELQTLNQFKTQNGCAVSLTFWLQRIVQIGDLTAAMNLEDNVLRLKIGGDGFHINRHQDCVNFYFTILNLGSLVHSPEYVFTLASIIAEESETTMQTNFGSFMQELASMMTDGIDLDIKIRFVYLMT